MSDPIDYLWAQDKAHCDGCDTRKRLEAEVAELRKRRDELLTSNNEFEQRYRDARRQLQESETLVGRWREAAQKIKRHSRYFEKPHTPTSMAYKEHLELSAVVDLADTLTPADALSDYRDGVLADFLRRQQVFSAQAFGPGKRTKGLIDHISKELKEIEADPTDLTEFIDVILLAFDGFWRHGGKPEELLPALESKLAKNMARTWPKPTSEDHAIEHVKDAAEIRAMKGRQS